MIITNNFHVGSEVSEREVLAVKNVATGKTYLFQVDKSHAPETAGDNYQYNASLISHNGKLLDGMIRHFYSGFVLLYISYTLQLCQVFGQRIPIEGQ